MESIKNAAANAANFFKTNAQNGVEFFKSSSTGVKIGIISAALAAIAAVGAAIYFLVKSLVGKKVEKLDSSLIEKAPELKTKLNDAVEQAKKLNVTSDVFKTANEANTKLEEAIKAQGEAAEKVKTATEANKADLEKALEIANKALIEESPKAEAALNGLTPDVEKAKAEAAANANTAKAENERVDAELKPLMDKLVKLETQGHVAGTSNAQKVAADGKKLSKMEAAQAQVNKIVDASAEKAKAFEDGAEKTALTKALVNYKAQAQAHVAKAHNAAIAFQKAVDAILSKDSTINKQTTSGASAVGSAVLGTVGFFVAGPAGAVAGGALGAGAGSYFQRAMKA